MPMRMVLTTVVASASPSTSFSDDQQRLPAFATASRTGSISRMLEIFFISQQDERVFQPYRAASGLLMKRSEHR